MKTVARLTAVVATGIISVSAFAESTPPEAIVVTATRFSSTEMPATANVSVITDADIARSAATNLVQVLQLQAGIQTQSLFGVTATKSRVDMGGFGPTGGSNTLVLLNGRRLNDADLSGTNLAAIPLNSIARIEIMHGSGAVLYGDNAVGGVINIITTDGFDKQPSTVALQAGTYQTGGVAARVRMQDSNTAYFVSAETRESSGYRDNNALDNKNLLAEITQIDADKRYGLRVLTSAERLRLPGALNEPIYLSNPRASVGTLENSTEEQRTLEGFFNSSGFAGEIAWRAKNQDAILFGKTHGDLKTVSVTPRYKFALDSQTLIAGVDLYRSSLGANGDFGAPFINSSDTVRNSYAAYVNDTITLSPAFALGIGARRQKVSFETTSTSSSGSTQQERSDTLSAFDATLAYKQDNGGRSYVRAAESFRFAVLDEVWSFFSGTISLLKPQRGHHLEIGTQIPIAENNRFAANLFRVNVEDEIGFDQASFSNVNFDPTLHAGVNLSWHVAPQAAWTVRLGLTYREATFRAGPNEGKRVPEIPSYSGVFSNGFDIAKNQHISFDGVYTGQRYFGNDFANVGRQMSEYWLWNLGYAYSRDAWTLRFAVNNLMNQKTADAGFYVSPSANPYNYYPLPERAFLFTLEAKL